MNNKYVLTDETIDFFGRTLYRIKAISDFGMKTMFARYGNIKAGKFGGFIENEKKLSISGNAWVFGNAEISGNAKVYGNAKVSGDVQVYNNAEISGDAKIYCNADYTTIKGFGTNYRNTTFFRCKDDLVRVKCGCFFGTIPEFREQVKKLVKVKLQMNIL